jgi:hypothetical protein
MAIKRDDGNFGIEGMLTHDRSNRIPEATPLSDKDLKGSNVPQKHVPFDAEVDV